MQKNWPLDLAALALLLSLFFGFKIGERALWAPVEGRYAEIATEMQASGDYVTPRLNGVKYLKKAPLFFWLEAFAVKVFGKSEWVFRAWGAVFAVLGCLAVYIVARNLYGRRAGLLSAIVLATSPLYYALSRTVSLDMTLTFFLAAALMSILWRRREANGLPYAGAILAFYVFAALATLTKGFVGIVMPAIILALWTALIRERRFPKSILLSWGPLWFVAIALPWHVLAAARNPEFWNVYFFQEHIQGYLTMDAEPHNQPWVFLPVLLMSGFPWTVFLVAAIRYHTRPALNEQWRETLLLLLWPAALLVFFSFSSSKVIPYILPMFPALAILIGAYLSFAWERADSWGIRAAGWLVLVGVCLLLGFGLGIPQYYAERHSNWPSLGPPKLSRHSF
jgi:4-amino-4-deoxy-L-arabinose transferase-like glycosyltransferase